MTKFIVLQRANLSLHQSDVYIANPIQPLHFVFHHVLRDICDTIHSRLRHGDHEVSPLE